MIVGNKKYSIIKRNMKKLILFLLILTALSACHNAANSFDNYDYSTVYFAYQYPVRTITLGEDIYDNSLDLQHKCQIQATIGGVYTTDHDVIIDFVVADTICNGYNLVSSLVAGRTAADPTVAITPMPHDYYTLASNQIVIKKGDISGGVEVQLTDKYFADPLAVKNQYVIPLLMTKVSGADSILQGKPLNVGTHPRMLYTAGWSVAAKNYVLYAVKYINPWHGFYMRRGVDVLNGAISGTTYVNSSNVRHPVEVTTYDAATDTKSADKYLNYLTTTSMTGLIFPVTLKNATGTILKNAAGTNLVYNLNLTFDASGNCTVTSSNPTVFTASGTGQFVKKGEKNSWGNVDRDVLYMNYSINDISNNITVATKDTLVMRNRGVVMEQFTTVAK